MTNKDHKERLVTSMKEIEELFKNQGGEFISPPSFIKESLASIRAYIFDWDGVFNNGAKDENKTSFYTEIDSMGLNMLRLGYWLSNNKELPIVSIITGENNKTAIKLAEREHFNHIYFSFKNKAVAFEHLLNSFNLKPEEVAFCFDDILDLPIAKKCGLKFMIRHDGTPLFKKYIIENGYCDYMTGQSGNNYAIREITELILGFLGQYDIALKERIDFGQNYIDYLEQRNTPELKKFIFENGIVKKC